MGGKDEDSNYVLLTAREHIFAHILLNRMYPDNISLRSSILLMTSRKSIYEYFSLEKISILREITSGIHRKMSEATKEKLRQINLGKHHSIETKDKLSKMFSGKNHPLYGKRYKMSEEHKKSISNSLKGRSLSDEHKENLSKSLKGKKKSEKSIRKMKETKRLNPYHFSEEQKEHLSKIRKGIPHSKLSEETKEKIRENNASSRKISGPDGTIYKSIAECSRLLNISDSTIGYWLKNHPEKGFKYINNK